MSRFFFARSVHVGDKMTPLHFCTRTILLLQLSQRTRACQYRQAATVCATAQKTPPRFAIFSWKEQPMEHIVMTLLACREPRRQRGLCLCRPDDLSEGIEPRRNGLAHVGPAHPQERKQVDRIGDD